MTTQRIKMQTAAAIQLRDAKGNPTMITAVSRDDEIELPEADAAALMRAGYATRAKADKSGN